MNDPVPSQSPIVSELLEALGLDPGRCTRVTIEFVPAAIVTVTVVQTVEEQEAEKIVGIVKRYNLKVVEEEEEKKSG